MGFQQILALLQGASADERVVVDYAQNFSFSGVPALRGARHRDQQAQEAAVVQGHHACVNVEGDEAAFGTRADKLEVCKLHRIAWRINLDLVKPLCLRVAPPRPDKQRARGDRRERRLGGPVFASERKRELEARWRAVNLAHAAAAGGGGCRVSMEQAVLVGVTTRDVSVWVGG